MPPDITALLSLQERDLRLQELRKELTRIPMEQELAGKRLAAPQAAPGGSRDPGPGGEEDARSPEFSGARRWRWQSW